MLMQQILSGLATGVIYAMLALGFASVYRSMRLINFAQGDLFMAGAFIGLFLAGHSGLSFVPVLIITCLFSFCLGVAFERLALAPKAAHAPEFNMMIRTIGLSVALQGAALLFRGTEEYRFPELLPTGTISVENLSIPLHLFYIGGASVLIFLALAFFMKYTQLGLCMRAASQDRLGAEIIGVNSQLVQSVAFGISAALAGAAGVLIAPLWYVHYSMGSMMGLKGFTAAVLGSLGSFPGAILGGLCLGIVENLTAGYVSSSWKDAVVFAVLLGVLALRPQGLFGLGYKARV
jgi:branched-chain amino acid transport system permease protein